MTKYPNHTKSFTQKAVEFIKSVPVSTYVLVVAVTLFLVIYGFHILNVTYDSWIYNGYIEHDIIQHYAGWMFYRESPWSWPLGIATNLTYPDGTSISLTDSIPIMAVFFKLFDSLLPEKFQYFGIFILICVVLQALFAAKLLGLFTKNKWLIVLGSILFTLSPIMHERAFRHCALAAHFLILAALYLYFLNARAGWKRLSYGYVAIFALATAIHPYFVPLVGAIFFADLAQYVIKNKISAIKRTLSVVGSVVLAVGLTAYSLGLLQGGSSGAGYGIYSLNINAIFNPSSKMIDTWSLFLPQHGQLIGQYDGFNYLGAGVLACLAAGMILLFVSKKNRQSVFNVLRVHWVLLLMAVVLTLFAITNSVTFSSQLLFKIELPYTIESLAGIFRASGRMFWLAYYLIFIALLVMIYKLLPQKLSIICVSLFITVQVIDLSPAFMEKKEYFKDIKSPLSSSSIQQWSDISRKKESAILLNSPEGSSYEFAIRIAELKMKTNTAISARSKTGIDQYAQSLSDLRAGIISDKNIYLTNDLAIVQELEDRAVIDELEVGQLRPMMESLVTGYYIDNMSKWYYAIKK